MNLKITPALVLLLAPAAAAADPISATAFLVAAAAASQGALVFAAVAAGVGLFTYGSAKARARARAARRSSNAKLEDRSVTTLQSVPPQRVIYGRTITGGEVHAIFTTDKTSTRTNGSSYTKPDAMKHLVIAIADHECQAINDVFIDGISVGALDGSGLPTGGEFFKTRKVTREISIAAGASSVQPYAVTVLSCINETVAAEQGDGVGYDTGTYSLSAGDTTITNTTAGASIRVSFTMEEPVASVRIQKMLGSPTQAVNAYLNGLRPAEWTSNHRLRGICYAVVTLDLELEQRFQGGPPNITFDVSGKKVYDPRTATTAWSQNPALCTRDFLLAEQGYAVTTADVDDTYVNAAANACEVRQLAAVHTYSTTVTADASTDRVTFANPRWFGVGDGVRFTTSGTLPAPLVAGTTYYVIVDTSRSAFRLATSRANALAGTAINITSAGSGTHTGTLFDYDTYTCNGSFTTAQGREEVLEELLESMAGAAVYGAKWQVMAGAWTAPVMDLGDADLHGQIEIVQGDVGMDQLINGVRGQFVPAGKATPTDMDSYQNATFLAADGVALWEDLSLPFVDNKIRARNLARIRVESARAGQIIRFPAKLRAWPLQVGDRVRVTSAEYGFSNKTFRVTDWQWGVTTAVVLTLQEDAASIWDLADAATADPTPNTMLPNPWAVAALAGVTATSGAANQARREDGTLITRVRVAWTPTTDAYVQDGSGHIRIEWRRQYFDADNTWRVITVPGDEAFAMLEGVAVGNVLTIRVMAVNGLGVRSSPAVVAHTVTGDVGSVGGGNLVSNSSFEADSDGDGVPDSWTATNFGSGITISRELSAPSVHGNQSLRLNVTAISGASTNRHVVLQPLADSPSVIAGRSYRVSVDTIIGNLNYQARYGVIWVDSGGSTISTTAFEYTAPATGQWNRVVGAVMTAPTGATKARPFVGLTRPSAGDTTLAAIRFDRFQLEEGTLVTAWAPRADELLPGAVDTDKIEDDAVAPIATNTQVGVTNVFLSDVTLCTCTIDSGGKPIYVSASVDCDGSYSGNKATFKVKVDGTTVYNKDVTTTRDPTTVGNPWSVKGALVQTVIAAPASGTRTITLTAVGTDAAYGVTVEKCNLYVEAKKK